MLTCSPKVLHQLAVRHYAGLVSSTYLKTGVSSLPLTAVSGRSRDQRRTSVTANETMNAAKRLIRGVIFDMDGTLTIPVIDFAEMRYDAQNPFRL